MSGFFEKRRVVVTGGAGFLGKYIVEGLKKRGCKNIFVPLIEEYDLFGAGWLRLVLGY